MSSDFDGFVSARIVGEAYQGFNVAGNMPGSPFYSFEIFVNDQPPFPTSGISILAELGIFPYYYDEPINLYLTSGVEFPAGYETDLGSAEFHPSSGGWDLPVAVINGPAPVAVESESWGQVKATFR